MSLPHFNKLSSYKYDVIYNSLFLINFENELLSDNCISIDGDKMTFNLFIHNDELVPYHIIKNFIKNKKIIKYLEVFYYDKQGTIEFVIFLKNFKFIKIIDLLDFNLEKYDEIKKLSTIFKYDDEYVIMMKDYDKFIRKIKLENINNY